MVDVRSRSPLSASTVLLRQLSASPDSQAVLPEVLARVVTDDVGGYHFSGLATGLYRVTVERLGYHPAAVEVHLRGSGSSRVTLALDVAPIELRPLSVSVTGQLLGGSVGPAAVVAAPEVRSPPIETAVGSHHFAARDARWALAFGEADVLRAVQRLPGATTRDEWTAEVWTRGGAASHTRVLYDGLPLFRPVQAAGFLSGADALSLDGVSYYPGARGLDRGGGVVGVVELTSRRATEGRRFTAFLSPASTGLSAQGRFWDGRAGYTVAGRRSWLDVASWLLGDRGSESSLPFGFMMETTSGRADYVLSEESSVAISWLTARDRLDGSIPAEVHQSTGEWVNDLTKVEWVRRSGRLRLFTELGRSRYRANAGPDLSEPACSDCPDIVRLEPLGVDLDRVLLRVSLSPWAGGPRSWLVGVGASRTTLAQTGAAVASAGGGPESSAADQVDAWARRRLGSDRWGAEVGARASVSSSEGGGPQVRWAPSVSMTGRVSESLRISVVGQRTLTHTQSVGPSGSTFGPGFYPGESWVLGGVRSGPAVTDVVEARAQLRLSESWDAVSAAWLRRSHGVLERRMVPGRFAASEPALGSTRSVVLEHRIDAKGSEVTIRRGGPHRWTGFGSYSWTRADARSALGSGPATTERRHIVDVSVRTRWSERVRSVLAFHGASGFPLSRVFDGQSEVVQTSLVATGPAYASLDVGLDWVRPGESISWRVALQVRNVLARAGRSAYRRSTCDGGVPTVDGCPGTTRDLYHEGITFPLPLVAIEARF
ncbi:MAG: carboxypeptidase-like regulatory domain-containing protein [Gemmatimonadota bacterium]